MKRKIYYFLYVLFGFILILAIKNFIRPLCLNCGESIIFILGVLPNLLVGLIIPILLLLFYPNLKLFWLFLISLIIIILMEIDLMVSGRNFDIYDIIFSVIGLMLNYLVFNKFRRDTI